jgi:hypothetical protein
VHELLDVDARLGGGAGERGVEFQLAISGQFLAPIGQRHQPPSPVIGIVGDGQQAGVRETGEHPADRGIGDSEPFAQRVLCGGSTDAQSPQHHESWMRDRVPAREQNVFSSVEGNHQLKTTMCVRRVSRGRRVSAIIW